MPTLADAVLPLIRSRSDLHRWSAANEHGRKMHDAVNILETALTREDPTAVLAVTQKAIASAISVIGRADDSSGIIGDAVQRLLAVHARAAVLAKPTAGKLVTWLVAFHLDGRQDFFEIDPVAYAPDLGEKGMAVHRAKLAQVAATLPPEHAGSHRWSDEHGHTRFVLDWKPNAWPCSTKTSRPSSAPTPGTGRSPPGSRTPGEPWARSASSTWPSTGSSRPPTSTWTPVGQSRRVLVPSPHRPSPSGTARRAADRVAAVPLLQQRGPAPRRRRRRLAGPPRHPSQRTYAASAEGR